MPLFGKKEKDCSSSSSRQRSKSPKPQNKDEKKRYQQAIWEVTNSPSKQADFSECGLTEVSSSITSSLAGKEALLLHDNRLVKISPSIKALVQLKVLDLHNNHLASIPSEISSLAYLTIINLEHNALKTFPSSLLALPRLETVNVAHNHISKLPADIGKLVGIRTLNLGHNAITELPLSLRALKFMDTLIITGNPIKQPALGETDKLSTEEVMRAICTEAGEEYTPPSQFLLNKINNNSSSNGGSTSDELLAKQRAEEAKINQLLEKKKMDAEEKARRDHMRREEERLLEEKRTQMLREEKLKIRQLAEDLKNETAQLSDRAMQMRLEDKQKKESLLQQLAKEEELLDDHAKKVVEDWNRRKNDPLLRQRLLEDESQAEQQLIAASIARAASHQAAVESMRAAEEEHAQLLSSHAMKLEDARKAALAQLRVHQDALDNSIAAFMDDVQAMKERRGETLAEDERRQTRLATGAAQESALQREAREKEISDVNERLRLLTDEYQQSLQAKNEAESARLLESKHEMEEQLKLLQLQQREKEKELMQTLVQLEEIDRRNYRSYWEAKLDYAMQHILEDEVPCDPVVRSVLALANLSHLEKLFAKAHVDAVVLRVLTDDDLANMSVAAIGDRKKILMAIGALFQDAAQAPPPYDPVKGNDGANYISLS